MVQARVVMAKLRAAWGDHDGLHAPDLADAVAALGPDAAAFDCVLLDLGLPDADGLEALKRIHRLAPSLPIVVLSGEDDETIALLAVREGAQDFLVKGQVGDGHIARAITHAIERKRQEIELVHQAFHDSLTALPNRRQFSSQLDMAITRMHRSPNPIALLYGDLDGFKPINDRLGHAAGDEVLVETAQRLRRTVRAGDLVARLGGDEFAVLCEGAGQSEAVEIAERVWRAVAAPMLAAGETVEVGISVGIATAASPEATAEDLLAEADAAMYREKTAAGAAR